MYTVFLKEAKHEPLLQVGSKALHLAHIIHEGVTVPDGFILKAAALDRFIKANHLQDHLGKEDFAQSIMTSPIPSEVEVEIISSYERLKEQSGYEELAVAVRSSSSAEDLEDASFAGQYDTILNVRNHDQLLAAVKKCWASLFSDHVREYVTKKNISLESFPMGILIQQMVYADVSGVIFSVNPITKDQDEVIINASYGLGEAIVSGIVTPDTYIVHKEKKTITKDLGLKEVKVIPMGMETVEVETTAEESESFCLNDDQVLTLESLTVTLEKFYQFPVDVEFAIKKGRPYILQSRPITA